MARQDPSERARRAKKRSRPRSGNKSTIVRHGMMASNQAAAAPTDSEPPAKMQKVIDSTDRLVLDVGGTKFVTTTTTLKGHSAYFASLLSDNWSESRDRGEDAIFLDRDPVAFGKLLAYMRRGMIKVEDIDVDVMILAEFLGVERLLEAIKIRWYINIGKGPVHSDDDDIAAAFDREHGGILKALSSGLFRYFLSRNEDDAEKDYATLSVDVGRGFDEYMASVTFVRKEQEDLAFRCGGIVGALNGLFAQGYTLDDDQIDNGWPIVDVYYVKFSRRSHSAMHSRATLDTFVPSDGEVQKQRGDSCCKQFAIQIKDVGDLSTTFIAPAEFSGNSDPFAESTLTDVSSLWLEGNDFVTREKELEEQKVLKLYLKFLSEEGAPAPRFCAIYSRQKPHEQQDK